MLYRSWVPNTQRRPSRSSGTTVTRECSSLSLKSWHACQCSPFRSKVLMVYLRLGTGDGRFISSCAVQTWGSQIAGKGLDWSTWVLIDQPGLPDSWLKGSTGLGHGLVWLTFAQYGTISGTSWAILWLPRFGHSVSHLVLFQTIPSKSPFHSCCYLADHKYFYLPYRARLFFYKDSCWSHVPEQTVLHFSVHKTL